MRTSPPRFLVVAVAVVASLLLLTTAAVVRTGARPDAPLRTDAEAPTPTAAPPTAVPTTSPPTTPPVARPTSAPPPAPVPTSTAVVAFAYQPLFPFASEADARAWQAGSGAGGHQPWHVDAEATALAFVGYLGYPGIDQVTSHTGDRADAEVGVGFATEGGRTSTAAIVHLVRIGSGNDAPWEVVGTADTSLTLTSPRYGAAVTSPVTVGGRITGVDEALHAQVRQLSSPGPLGESCCPPAGGDATPWHATVSFHGATQKVLTVSVSTGGHFQAVERFAVTGVTVS